MKVVMLEPVILRLVRPLARGNIMHLNRKNLPYNHFTIRFEKNLIFGLSLASYAMKGYDMITLKYGLEHGGLYILSQLR
jgi:hypothetical protein